MLAHTTTLEHLRQILRDSNQRAPRQIPMNHFLRADDGIRTRDPHLGKVMLYQLSHVRMAPVAGARRAGRAGVRFRTVADPVRPANSPGGATTPGRPRGRPDDIPATIAYPV